MTTTVCPHCQAENQSGVTRCWLCNATLGEEIVLAEVVRPVDVRSGRMYTVTALLVLVALVALSLGMWDQAPGLAVLLLIVAAPAVILTLIRLHVRRRKGEQISGWRTALDFMLSAVIAAVVALGISSIAVVCLVVYLFIICTQGFSR